MINGCSLALVWGSRQKKAFSCKYLKVWYMVPVSTKLLDLSWVEHINKLHIISQYRRSDILCFSYIIQSCLTLEESKISDWFLLLIVLSLLLPYCLAGRRLSRKYAGVVLDSACCFFFLKIAGVQLKPLFKWQLRRELRSFLSDGSQPHPGCAFAVLWMRSGDQGEVKEWLFVFGRW